MNDEEHLLTPSAQRNIDDYIEKIRNEIIDYAYKYSLDLSGNVDEISSISIREAINLLEKHRDKESEKRRNRLLTINFLSIIYILLGVAIMTFSLFIYSGGSSIYRQSVSLAGVVTTLLGALISLYSNYRSNLLAITRPKKPNNVENTSYDNDKFNKAEIVIAWADLEKALRKKLNLGEKAYSIGTLIDMAIKSEIIDRNDVEAVYDFLKLRNQVAHGADNRETVEKSTKMIASLRNIIDVINNAIIR